MLVAFSLCLFDPRVWRLRCQLIIIATRSSRQSASHFQVYCSTKSVLPTRMQERTTQVRENLAEKNALETLAGWHNICVRFSLWLFARATFARRWRNTSRKVLYRRTLVKKNTQYRGFAIESRSPRTILFLNYALCKSDWWFLKTASNDIKRRVIIKSFFKLQKSIPIQFYDCVMCFEISIFSYPYWRPFLLGK